MKYLLQGYGDKRHLFKKRGGENIYLLLIRPRDITDAFYPAYGLNH